MQRTQSETVIFDLVIGSGGHLALVQTETDITIRRNGELVEGCFWRVGELDKAIDEYTFIVQRLSGGQE